MWIKHTSERIRPHGVRWAAFCLSLALVSGCGASIQTDVATTGTATSVSAVTPPAATHSFPSPAQTPAAPPPTPTSRPDPATIATVELPPSLSPSDEATLLRATDALLYTDRRGLLMLADTERELWLTGNAVCEQHINPEQGAWSADGRFVAITCQQPNPTVAILDLHNGRVRQLDLDRSSEGIQFRSAASWSPAASTLLIVSTIDGKSRLSAVDVADGAAPERTLFEVDAAASRYLRPAWSHDGTQIAVYTGNGAHGVPGTGELYLLAGDGAIRQRFTPTVSGDRCGQVEWSRDSRFVFVVEEPGAPCTQIAVDTGAESYMNYLNGDQSPHWSPDGARYIAHEWPLNPTSTGAPAGGTEPRWSLRSADGRLIRAFPNTPERELIAADWMPDSQHLVMLARRAPGGVELTGANLD
ncbi:MAG TPA: hypothetical protein VFX76_03605, partial [Roseiflexaceae bacterium]|nr:hypothetical protein [Roseiflexaceae bacterium]